MSCSFCLVVAGQPASSINEVPKKKNDSYNCFSNSTKLYSLLLLRAKTTCLVFICIQSEHFNKYDFATGWLKIQWNKSILTFSVPMSYFEWSIGLLWLKKIPNQITYLLNIFILIPYICKIFYYIAINTKNYELLSFSLQRGSLTVREVLHFGRKLTQNLCDTWLFIYASPTISQETDMASHVGQALHNISAYSS